VPTGKCRVVCARSWLLTDLLADRGVLTSAHQEEVVDASKSGKAAQAGAAVGDALSHCLSVACQEAMIDDATLLRMRR
jgi:hypothetical protein